MKNQTILVKSNKKEKCCSLTETPHDGDSVVHIISGRETAGCINFTQDVQVQRQDLKPSSLENHLRGSAPGNSFQKFASTVGSSKIQKEIKL